MYKKPEYHLCANNTSLCFSTLEKAIILSGLTWGVHPSQVCAIHMNAMVNVSVVKAELKDDSFLLEIPQTQNFMLGIPVEMDPELPLSVVELRHNGAVIFTIDSLSIPWGFD